MRLRLCGVVSEVARREHDEKLQRHGDRSVRAESERGDSEV